MLFLTPNQQCESTESTVCSYWCSDICAVCVPGGSGRTCWGRRPSLVQSAETAPRRTHACRGISDPQLHRCATPHPAERRRRHRTTRSAQQWQDSYCYHLLPPHKPLHDALRVRGHQFQLPNCIYKFHKQSFTVSFISRFLKHLFWICLF